LRDFQQHGIPQGYGRVARALPHLIEGALADAARRRVHRALEGGIVGAIRDQAQVGERVLDLGALEEAQAAVDAVGQAAPASAPPRRRATARCCDRGWRRLRSRRRRAIQWPDALDHEARLVHFVVGGVQIDRLAVAAFGPQALAEAAGLFAITALAA
jgi:hypothetical protein